MSNIDFTPAQIKATGVRPNSVRSALTSNAKHKEMTVKKNKHIVKSKSGGTLRSQSKCKIEFFTKIIIFTKISFLDISLDFK